jgi:hypothetical protein
MIDPSIQDTSIHRLNNWVVLYCIVLYCIVLDSVVLVWIRLHWKSGSNGRIENRFHVFLLALARFALRPEIKRASNPNTLNQHRTGCPMRFESSYRRSFGVRNIMTGSQFRFQWSSQGSFCWGQCNAITEPQPNHSRIVTWALYPSYLQSSSK